MENTIADLLDAIIPRLDQLLRDMRLWMALASILGPVLFIGLGMFYLRWAPPEANHKLGYRTYFGMGSVSAWKYTQKLAGKVWTGVGIGLAAVALIGCILLFVLEPAKATTAALVVLIVEFVAALAAFAAVELMVLLRYDINGKKRKKK